MDLGFPYLCQKQLMWGACVAFHIGDLHNVQENMYSKTIMFSPHPQNVLPLSYPLPFAQGKS